MRRPFICGNWKMNLLYEEAINLANNIKNESLFYTDRDILIAPPFVYLTEIKEYLKNSNVVVSAQNVHWEEKGAFTGEVSPAQLKSCGIFWTIIGHSERRNIFGETDEIINKKVLSSLRIGLNIILCIGESLNDRDLGLTTKVIEKQLKESLKNVAQNDIYKLTIAYEPVWAIGTGRNATPTQIEEAHTFIRELIKTMYGREISDYIRILYGGSVNENNIDEIMNTKNVDGVLVGGASIIFEKFKRIIGFKK